MLYLSEGKISDHDLPYQTQLTKMILDEHKHKIDRIKDDLQKAVGCIHTHQTFGVIEVLSCTWQSQCTTLVKACLVDLSIVLGWLPFKRLRGVTLAITLH
ncbi:hypothetical protein FA15DRAFT_604536 [Coprinopsis marcescibilis]|uniref:Uncharacterized protein n=1 Tax=Coprinopsis marcescibilis TaxID=230819 RepID=A0A5C3KCQ5_COPMA|nr:hypothetical protein FA15DRAFT_604536 [Coprinopsis marcescibilis]